MAINFGLNRTTINNNVNALNLQKNDILDLTKKNPGLKKVLNLIFTFNLNNNTAITNKIITINIGINLIINGIINEKLFNPIFISPPMVLIYHTNL